MSTLIKHTLISKNGGVLNTAGKYCDKNIQVVPKLADSTFTANGSYPVPEGYAGYGDVNVDIPEKEEIGLSVKSNGTYTAPEGHVYNRVEVHVPEILFGKYNLSVGEKFTYEYGDTLPYVECPNCFEYEEADGVLTFTAVSEGSGVIYIRDDANTIAKFDVSAAYDHRLIVGENVTYAFEEYESIEKISAPDCVTCNFNNTFFPPELRILAVRGGSGVIVFNKCYRPGSLANRVMIQDQISVAVAYDHELKVGETFTYDYSAEEDRPSVDCPNNLSYSDNGSVLTFTALSVGTGVINIIFTYTVTDTDEDGEEIETEETRTITLYVNVTE